jgi:hypothetical protein
MVTHRTQDVAVSDARISIIAPPMEMESDAARPDRLFNQGRLRMLSVLQRIVDAEGPRMHR